MIFLVAGVVSLLVAELAGFASVRIVAVALLVAGAVGVGITAGLKPRATGSERATGLFSRRSAGVLAAVLVAPVLAMLAGSLAGAVVQLGSSDLDVNVPLVVAGGVIALFLLTVAVGALIVGINAIRGKVPDQSVAKEV